ncbi:MAG: SpoIID/LytB domain-containing protein [Salinivenus sp.]
MSTLRRGGCLLVATMLWSVGALAAWGQDTLSVRVRIEQQRDVASAVVTVEEERMEVQVPGGSAPAFTLQPGDTLRVGRRRSEVFASAGTRGLYSTSVRLTPAQDPATWSMAPADRDPRTYRGGLRVSPDSADGLVLVNHVPLEEYVASVVASEYGLEDDPGAKAMAVVARTYGLFATKKFGPEVDHADGKLSQVYEGTDVITARSRRAAESTRGQVLTHDGQPIQAVYFSSSGGHTADNEDVWDAEDPLPYLRARSDPYDDESPHHRWQASVSRSDLLQALTRIRGRSVNGFTLGDRMPHGRLKTVELLLSDDTQHTMNANAFRLAVNKRLDDDPLKSTWFDARREGDTYVFEGRGYGHGVGLSQWGAHAMGTQGHSYEEILEYYFTDISIRRHEGSELAPPADPVTESPAVSAPSDSSSGRIGW